MVGRGGIYGDMHGDGQPVHRSSERELTYADFCPLCGVCLPPDERCTSPNFKGSLCPHAEAAASYGDAHG